MAAGASMVQLYTALIYDGPGLVKSLNSGLVGYINRNGCRSLQEAVGLWKEGLNRDKAA